MIKQNGYNPKIDMNLETIPKRYRGKKFSDLTKFNAEMAVAIEDATRYAENFAAVKKAGASGFFSGGVGTGKTLLSCIILETVIRAGYQAEYTTAWKLVQDIRVAYSDRTTTASAQISRYVRLDLLVIDEIGVQNGTDDERVLIYQVIDGRYNDCQPTIIVSNSHDPVADGYIDYRTIDRLADGGGFSITFSGGSYRK